MKSPQSHDKFLILQQKSLDILAIQEAHCPENQFQSWKEFFSPKISYWSHYCGFIISPNQQFSNLQQFKFDNHLEFNDRLISIDIVFENQQITILNIYAPNDFPSRTLFFNLICNLKFSNEITIMGDFNQIDHPSFDKFPPLEKHQQTWEAFNNLKFSLNVSDCVTPSGFDISLMTRVILDGPRIVLASRIDLILISNNLTDFKSSYKSSISNISDHNLASILFSKIAKTPNTKWDKINPISLQNPAIVSQLSKFLISKTKGNVDFNQWITINKQIIQYYSKIGS